MSFTTDPNDPRLGHGADENPVPQNEVYLVLSEEERRKGFVRQFRKSYVHVGRKIDLEGGTLREFTPEEKEQFKGSEYAGVIEYTETKHGISAKFVTREEMDNVGKFIGGCGGLTTMADPLAETYARDPGFYGSTYCCDCQKHLPVAEFMWDGTDEKVGS
jgi:hypothetical protein